MNKLIIICIPILTISCVSNSEKIINHCIEDKNITYPKKLALENRSSYKKLLLALEVNSKRLNEAFKTKDSKQEKKLYSERQKILASLRDLMPKSIGKPLIHEGIVKSKSRSNIMIQESPNKGSSIRIGKINSAKLQNQYDAIRVGEHIKLVWTLEPGLINNDHYSYELKEITRTGTGINNIQTFK